MDFKKSVVIGTLTVLFLLPLASAGAFDFLTGFVLGGTDTTNVTASITSNSAPVIVSTVNTGTPTIAEAGTATVTVNLSIFDLDGASDINLTQTYVNITFTCYGEARNRNTACTNTTVASATSTYINFTCPVTTFKYYDCAGNWVINATTVDLYSSPATSRNDTTTVTLNALNALDIFPLAISFGSLSSGDLNKTSIVNNTINNTGNTLPVSLDLNSTNLKGTTNNNYQFNASYFKAINSNVTTLNNPCANAVSSLQNYTFVVTGNATLGARPQVNLDAGQPGQYVDTRYCINTVPTLPRQNYTTAAEGKWTLRANF